ncbi:hypothetical protein PBCVAP110A_493L [Paramecium bursaria Chlorella virus AP110A]|nr:hypothetical protein PBCVAP110A_493L [Paramecium bursaria Chlorella virus AP110A]
MSDYIKKTLEYYFEDGFHVIFKKYTIDDLGIIKNKRSGQTPSYGNGMYNMCSVYDDDGKWRWIRVARAVASTFLGKPPTAEHTADHIESEQKKNDALTNIRWNCKPGQRGNQIRSETNKSAFIVVKDGIEKTANEWVDHMNATKLPKEREFTKGMIAKYAQRKTRGFAYKVYPDLEGEEWRKIKGSNNKKGRWEISNMNRVKYITNHAENVLWSDRLGHNDNGYPYISINGKNLTCHILAFEAFNPKVVQEDMLVLHEDDNKEDFRPHKLYLGTHSDNNKDSYDNGKREGTKTTRKKCASYIDGVLEKDDYLSLADAAEYLKSKGYPKASYKNIGNALSVKCKSNTAYGRTWKCI